MIKKTHKALALEKELIQKYQEHESMKGSIDAEWYKSEKQKLKEIEEAEETAEK